MLDDLRFNSEIIKRLKKLSFGNDGVMQGYVKGWHSYDWAMTVVAKRNKKIVGWALIPYLSNSYRSPSLPEIHVFVDPNYRMLGIGTKLYW
jgi:hypothetical protein